MVAPVIRSALDLDELGLLVLEEVVDRVDVLLGHAVESLLGNAIVCTCGAGVVVDRLAFSTVQAQVDALRRTIKELMTDFKLKL